jgi:endonuclease/exonuclease/phosphatase (EEP) superfamily protein YafD
MTDPAHSRLAGDLWRCGRCGAFNLARPYPTHCLACGTIQPSAGSGLNVEEDRPPRRRLDDWISTATWVYAVLVLATLVLIRWVGEAWWGVTLLLFLPRWLFLVPIALLALAGLRSRRSSRWAVQGALALVVAGPLMGLSMPIYQLWRGPIEGERFRVLTFNRGDGWLDVPALVDLIEREEVNLICFQEGLIPDPRLEAYLANGWWRDRQRLVASRYPIVAEREPPPDRSTKEGQSSARFTRVRIRAPSGREFWLVSLHMPTLRPGFNRFLAGDIRGLSQQIDWWRRELARVVDGLAEIRDQPFLIGGDFNMPSDDATMAGLRSVCRFGFEEAGWGYGYTRPTSMPWIRIDHILASPEWVFTRCWVGPDLGSDHLPLLAEVDLPSPPKGDSK